MRRVFVCLGMGVVLLAPTVRAQRAVDPAKDRAAVEQIIRDSIGWALTKDRALAERVIAHDPDLFMFNPDSKSTVGWDAFVKNFDFWMDPRFKATSFDVRELRLTFARSGEVAWWSAMLDDLALWDGKPTGWKDTRWTGVLEKRGGAWVIVQMHFSFAADKVRAEALATQAPKPGAIPDTRELGAYEDLRAQVGELYKQKKYAEAAALLERMLDRFPENVRANTYNLALMRVLLGDRDRAMQALEDGLRRGVFYGKWDFEAETLAPLKQHGRFPAFWAQNLARLEEAQRNATMKLEVVTPAGYDPARSYPLFIALHGGGESLAQFTPAWVSPRLRAEFITAYVQSSQVASMTGFHWQDEPLTRRDLDAAYREVLVKYPVDRSRVLVGGFSSGGFAAMVAAFHQVLPVRGFVALCPEVPTSISDAEIAAAAKRGLRGSLLTTELDRRIEAQRLLADRWKALGVDGEFVVTPDIGHWYPKDFGQQLDRAIDRILSSAARFD